MRNSKSLRLLFALLAVFALVAAACGDDDDDAVGDGEGIRVGMVYDIGGRGDLSFNDSAPPAWTGPRASSASRSTSSSPPRAARTARSCCALLVEEGYDLIFGVGFLFDRVHRRRRRRLPRRQLRPDRRLHRGPRGLQHRASCSPRSRAPSSSVPLRRSSPRPARRLHRRRRDRPDQEVRGRLHRRRAGGQPRHRDRSASYISQPPDFSASTTRPAAGDRLGMFEGGADVVYHAAGGSGAGLFEAARYSEAGDSKVWAIGVDSDQYLTASPRSSALHPHLDAEEGRRGRVPDAIEAHVDGDFAGRCPGVRPRVRRRRLLHLRRVRRRHRRPARGAEAADHRRRDRGSDRSRRTVGHRR
jgi:basic membrane protein A and related proteins